MVLIRVEHRDFRGRLTVQGNQINDIHKALASTYSIPLPQVKVSLTRGGPPLSPLDSMRTHRIVDGSILYLLSDAPVVPSLISKPEQPTETPAASPEDAKEAPKEAPKEATGPKFDSFDHYILERDFNISDLAGSQHYKTVVLENGKMNKIPPPITLKHQPYRHVDHVEFMNVNSISAFVRYWQQNRAVHRGGWLLGYFVEDNHYPLGIRAVVEGVYEPPQSFDGKIVEFSEDDPNMTLVEKMCGYLGLRIIGHIFTHDKRDELLTSWEVISIAKKQLKYRTPGHYTGYPVGPLVTVTVHPSESGHPEPSAFMVSDMGMQFVVDDLLAEPTEGAHLNLKVPEPQVLFPEVLEGGRETKTFDVHWLVVRLNEGAPKKSKSIFGLNEFPVQRSPAPPTPISVANFLRNHNRGDDFNFLLGVGKLFDAEALEPLCIDIALGVKSENSFLDVLKSLA